MEVIKIKYKILNKENGITTLLIYYDDATGNIQKYHGNRDLEEILKDAYIQTINPANRIPIDEVPEGLETYHKPQSVAKFMHVDFYNLTVDIYDQFGDKMNVDVEFTIDGAGARIENGTIIEDAVDSDTSYFIVAKYKELEERQERTIYAPVEEVLVPDVQTQIYELEQAINLLADTTLGVDTSGN